MSSDEFDPDIERLFARTPHMPDAPLFVADVETKLASSSRVRTLALTLAGLVGGAVAVSQAVRVNVNLSTSDSPVAGRALGEGIQAASVGTQDAVQSILDQVGLADLSFGSMSGMQLFWITAAALIALAAAGVMKLSQEA
ncbi:MAG TPA: hypothetical protein VF633_11365 [Brevundimonas sp.]|jgi:hypothetical protein